MRDGNVLVTLLSVLLSERILSLGVELRDNISILGVAMLDDEKVGLQSLLTSVYILSLGLDVEVVNHTRVEVVLWLEMAVESTSPSFFLVSSTWGLGKALDLSIPLLCNNLGYGVSGEIIQVNSVFLLLVVDLSLEFGTPLVKIR